MPLYQYQALDQKRQDVMGEVLAEDPDAALAKIRAQGLFPTSLKEKFKKVTHSSTSARAPSPRSRPAGAGWFGISLKKLIYFTRQFSAMQDAGLPILRTLQVLHKQQKRGLFRRVLGQVVDDVREGNPLAEALARHPRVFDQMYVKMVAAGEVGGLLEPILSRLAAGLERSLEFRRKVIKASVYPAFIVFFTILILIFIMVIVVPMLISSLNKQEVALTGPIRTLNSISHWFTGGDIPGWVIILVTPFLVVLGIQFLKQFDGLRYFWDMFKLRIPLFGRLVRKIVIARFSRVMGMLIGAGVPILGALRTSSQIVGNRVFSKWLVRVEESVREGENLAKSLEETGLFTLAAINMVEVGEETGDLDKTMLKMAEIYEDDVDSMVTYMTNLLGPLLLICIALVVGFIIVAMFIAVFSIAGSQLQ